MIKNQRFVLVNGASSDIGVAVLKSLLDNGFEPLLVGRDIEVLSDIASKLSICTKRCFYFDNDNIELLPSLFKDVVNKFGKLSGMVLCAGYHELRPLKSHNFESLSKTFHHNVMSTFMFAKYFSSNLYSEKNSSIVFISSTAALLGESGLSAYSAAKGALISCVKSLAVELATKGCRVNCVSPGWVETKHAVKVKDIIGDDSYENLKKSYPLGLGSPEDIAGPVVFLLSDKSRWITGQNFIVDGGRTLL